MPSSADHGCLSIQPVVELIAVGSAAGGVLGARVGRRLHPAVLRAVIVVVGPVAIASLVWP